MKGQHTKQWSEPALNLSAYRISRTSIDVFGVVKEQESKKFI